MAAVDASGVVYVFFTTKSTQDVFYSWQDQTTKKWAAPKSLTNIKDFKGMATAYFDEAKQKIIVQVYGVGDGKLYTYTQGDQQTFTLGTSTPSTLSALDRNQLTNGTTLETSYSITLNSVPDPEEAPSLMSTIFGRAMKGLMTMGASEIAEAVHTEQLLASEAAFLGIEKKVCP
jgi:hypothetical protein